MVKKYIPKSKCLLILLLFLVVALPLFAISPVTSWMTDMWNQPSIKPQEEGSMMSYPVGSVTTDGTLVTSDGQTNPSALDPSWFAYRNDATLAPPNPVQKTAESIANGEYLYNVNCAACHGKDGMGQTPVGMLRGAPPISILIEADPTITEGYIFSKIQFGNIAVEGMPPLGYQTTPKERWDIVNYVFSKWSSK